MIGLLLELFISFAKIGFTSFGGLSMVPLITSEMAKHGWMSEAEIANLIAIAEMTPGPLGVNCSTFAGMNAAGIPGAIAAALGVISPCFTLGLLAAVFFERFKNSARMRQALTGIRPVCLGLIFGVVLSLSLTNYFTGFNINVTLFVIGAIDLFCLVKLKWSVPAVIGLSALYGMLFS